MIKLESRPTDAALQRLQQLEASRVAAIATGTELSPALAGGYRHADVKSAIVSETRAKCAYCESKITHVYWGDVEHILPKSVLPARTFDYDNLTLACALCNNGKGSYSSATAPIINPYEDEPNEHLLALGQIIWHRGGSSKGWRTILLLQLNRDPLMERRFERLQYVSAIADQYQQEPDGPIKRTLLAQLRELADPAEEFSVVVRTFLQISHDILLDATALPATTAADD